MTYMTTQELMDLYGVSWFKMDENTGNSMIDSKGSAVARFTGTCSVYEGISGNCKYFSGQNNYVRFSTKVLPLGKKSIRFKIKNDSRLHVYILGNSQSDYYQHGENVRIDGVGRLVWESFRNTNLLRFKITSSIIVNDNLWHDILLTWDGTTNVNGVKMYLDDMYVPHKTGTASSIETSTQSNNFAIAVNPYTNANLYSGYIDEIEIYNEAIILSPPPVNKILLSSLDGTKVFSLKPEKHGTETAVPKMISNISPSGRAFASSVYSSSYGPYLAFNRIDDQQGYVTQNGVIEGHLGYEFDNSIIVGKYSIRSGTSPETSTINAMPKNWTFEGSNDGVKWEVLDTQTDQVWTAALSDKTYSISIPQSFKMYRLNWITNNGFRNYTNINELKMYQFSPGIMYELNSVSESNFVNYGIENEEVIDFTQAIQEIVLVAQSSSMLGSGRLYEHQLDLSRRRVKNIKI